MTWETVRLGDVVDVMSGFAFDSGLFAEIGGLPLVRIRDVVRGASATTYRGEYDEKYVIYDGDLLVGMDGEFNRGRWSGGRALLNQRVSKLVTRSELLESGYLYHALPIILKRIEAATPFVTVKHLSSKVLASAQVPLPPLAEQRRIAAILDEADALRAAARGRLSVTNDSARHAITEILKSAPESLRLGDLVAEPFRNGISPSRTGSVVAEVLTLSAITRGSFDPRARKTDTFAAPHSSDKLVRKGLHLICRGNGNPDLVGTMTVATVDLDGVAFPDTIIAMRPSRTISSTALDAAWRTDGVRDQIRRGARTTNGTYKINQQLLAQIMVPVGTPDQQAAIGRIEEQRSRVVRDLTSAIERCDELFASLQYRAFRGEL